MPHRRIREVAISFPITAAMVFFLTAACGTAPAATERPNVKLKAGVLPYISYAPFFIAEEEGFFAEQGLDVEMVRFGSGAEMIPPLDQGQIDVAGSGPSIGLFNAIGHNGTIKIVADKGYLARDGCTYMAILAPVDWVAQNPAPKKEALRGKKMSIGTTNFEAFMFEKFVAPAGLTMDDFELEDLSPPTLIDAVEKDAIDLISQGEPWVTRLLDTGKMAVWKGYESIVPDMQVGIILFGPNLLNAEPDLGVRFMTAYLKAVRQYNLGKTDRNLEILAKNTNLQAELLRRACWPPIADDAHVNLETILEYQAWGVGKGLVADSVSSSSLYDPRYIEAADSALEAGQA